MKISYVVPSFNHAQYIFQSLESIKEDIFGDYEIIILDDGSTDESSRVIEDWISKNAELNVFFIQQKNQGICYSLNKLISVATGSYIRAVGSDDRIVAGSTQLLVEALEKQPKALMAFGDAEVIDQHGNSVEASNIDFLKKDKSLYVKNLPKAIISEWGVAGPVFVWRKDFNTQTNYYNESLVIEDWNMYLKMAGLNQLVFINVTVAQYRIHETNTSKTKNVQKRLVNLRSQYLGGYENLVFYEGKNRRLLKSELSLLLAKISYLKKNIFGLAVNMIKYYWFKLF
jgi:glycosyltransferase involved in cell wall biosynthesis